MRIINTVITKITGALDLVGGLVMAALMALIAINVVMRIFNMPVPGVSEWIPFMLATSVGLTISYCAVQGGHIAMGFMVDRLPRVLRLIIEVIMQLVVIAFVCLTAWVLWQYGFSTMATNTVGMVTRIPIYPFVFIVAFGFSVFILAAINGLLQLFVKKEDGR